MINGAHVIIYSKDAEADRSFFKDVLGFHHVDAGHGWLIFALPPAEVACHPGDENNQHELYLMCDDLAAMMSALDAKGIHCSDAQEPPWGIAHHDHSARWWQARSLSTKTSNGS